jgi:two-component system phosphate regulon sensor histidine kinase PhoR
MFQTIRRRIAFPYLALILLAMLVISLYFTNTLRQTYLDELNHSLASQAALIAESLIIPLSNNSTPDELDLLAKKWAEASGTRVTIIAPDGLVLGESHEDRRLMNNHANRPEIIQALKDGKGTSIRYSTSTSIQSVYSAAIIRSGGKTLGIARVSLTAPSVAENINQVIQAMVGLTAIVTSLAGILAVIIASSTSKPVREITQAVTNLAESDFTNLEKFQRLTPSSPEEIGRLMHAFNILASRLRSEINSLQTERKKMDAVLQEMSDGVVIVDSNGLIQMINHSAEEMFSVQRHTTINHTLVESLRHYQIIELWQRCRDSNKPQSTPLEISVNHLYLQGLAAPLDNFLVGHTMLIFQNMTRQRYLETMRRDFISNLSHELRTPLASLKALTETLQEGALDDPPAARRFLKRIETEVDALTQMVAELLELSRIESGRVPLEFKTIPPQGIILSAVERLRLQAERSQLKLILNCHEDLPPILADPTRLEQVLVNLLHNAIKFTDPGGEIRVSAALDNSETKKQDQILFTIQDTGVGIAAVDLQRIFERFYKADRARSSGGTGLGLAIARHIVEAHHGAIWAESIEGKGSIFYITIPCA